MAKGEGSIPRSRARRTAELGLALGGQGARYAGTRAANVARPPERGSAALERRHLEAAAKLVGTLGHMKGAAMKLGQLASFIELDFLPEEYRPLYQEQLATLRSSAPALPWKRVRKLLASEWGAQPESLFAELEPDAVAAASIGQVHRGVLRDGRRVAVKVQYPGVADAIRADLQNVAVAMRLARALAPGLDARAVAAELRERVLEELDYELEAQNQRSFARGYRGHPFIRVPDVLTELSTERVLVSDWIDGIGFDEVRAAPQPERDRFGEIVFRFYIGSIFHLGRLMADPHPGNYLLQGDGRVAFLDYGMSKRVARRQVELELAAIEAVFDDDPERLRLALHELGFLRDPSKVDAERLMAHVRAVGGWYMEDREVTIDADVVLRATTAMADPRSSFYGLVRQESLPADELMGRRMETGVLAVLGKLGATRNWCRIGREWWFGAEPATELGRLERDFFGRRR